MIVSHVRDNMRLIRFTASWCQPCKTLAKNLEKADLNIPIEVVDVDVHEELAIKYGIRSVPTLILNNNGDEKRLVGVKSPEEIKEWISR